MLILVVLIKLAGVIKPPVAKLADIVLKFQVLVKLVLGFEV